MARRAGISTDREDSGCKCRTLQVLRISGKLSVVFLQREIERTDKLFLYVDLPRFDFPVVFAEQVSFACSIVTYRSNRKE